MSATKSGPPTDGWAVLQVFHSIIEADQLASLLQSGGWDVRVRPAAGGGLPLTGVLPGHEVLVPAQQLDAVRDFLAADPST